LFFDIIGAIVSQNLSPLDSKPLNGYGECGTCADENAVCIDVAGQRTCWCRAGYVKRENKCGMKLIRMIFKYFSNVYLKYHVENRKLFFRIQKIFKRIILQRVVHLIQIRQIKAKINFVSVLVVINLYRKIEHAVRRFF
jgi:hypothetical protein